MKQADIFLQSEGDNWLERNRTKLGQHDPVSDIIEFAKITPTSVLEVGCANGWRLAKLRDRYGCNVSGVEPSMQAGIEAADMRVPVVQMTASILPFMPESFDLVIYGFCLYLTDPQDWFRIAGEADRVLSEHGHIIIHDFDVNSHRRQERPRLYEHNPAIISYHIDFSRFWQAHPQYYFVTREKTGDDEMVTLLRKRGVDSLQVGI